MNILLFILLYDRKHCVILYVCYGLEFYPGEPNVKGHPYEIHETSDDSLAIILNLVSPIYPRWYKPLQLPPTLHDFHVKYYKFLPKFDGESENLTAEKHVQAFDHFSDLFEIEHDDFCMWMFALSLQGDAKF